MNEAGLNARWLKAGLESGETKKFAVSVLNHMREKLIGYQMEYGNLYGLEATPAESATFRFARLDRERFPGSGQPAMKATSPIIQTAPNCRRIMVRHLAGCTHKPGFPAAPLYHRHCIPCVHGEGTGGLEKGTGSAQRHDYQNTVFPCFTLSPVYTICQTCGYLPGRQERCPKCNGAADVYSRIAGYYRPVHDWNDGKAQEFKNRVMFPIGE